MLLRTNKNKVCPELTSLLGQISKIEYSLIINYPQLARMIKDKKTQELVNSLGIASIHHFDVVSKALAKLGGNPTWSMELLPDKGLDQIFNKQLEKEIKALEIHQRCAILAQDYPLKYELIAIANEEKSHIKTVETILSNLSKGAAEQDLSSHSFGGVQ